MNKELAYEVSNLDLKRKIHHKIKIIEYPMLRFCNNIVTQYLKSSFSILVILLEAGYGNHWTVLIRRNKVLTYFDSYGIAPDGELKNIATNVRIKLHETEPYLSLLLNKAKENGFQVVFNKTKFQQYSPKINTCGKHVAAISNAMIDGLTLAQYTTMMKQTKKQNHISYDEIVCELFDSF